MARRRTSNGRSRRDADGEESLYLLQSRPETIWANKEAKPAATAQTDGVRACLRSLRRSEDAVNLTNDDVEEIIRILESSFYDELRIKTDAFDLTLRRSSAGWTEERLTLTRPRMIGAVESEALPKAGAPTPAEPIGAETAGGATVRAPMVGTFYRAPKPGAAPFVDIGAEVGEHTVVGIIEVMKLMNSVSAGAAGTVTEIYASDGQLVEAGQVLMRLRQPPT